MTRAIAVAESSQVAEARRAAASCARELAFSVADEGKAALVATELATNLVKHGGGGSLLVQPRTGPRSDAVDIIAIDKGAGMANIEQCLTDGYSTAGSAGTGLGCVRRAARHLDVYSTVGRGTVAVATVGPSTRADEPDARLDIASIMAPYPGEWVCGDTIEVTLSPSMLAALVADGLGHGQHAAAAAATAATLFLEQAASTSPGRLIERLHQGMRHTRGAAGLIVSIDLAGRQLTYCGVGNISGAIFFDGNTKRFVSHNGTLGHEFRRAQEFMLPWTDDTLLVVHSDGISAHFKLEDYPGLAACSAAIIGAVVYRDFRRQRDDASVLVVRAASNGSRV